MNQWELLAAVQALMIYMLMRLIEGSTENTSFDVPLLNTILVSFRIALKVVCAKKFRFSRERL
jgi:DNA polymerase III psi subunit